MRSFLIVNVFAAFAALGTLAPAAAAPSPAAVKTEAPQGAAFKVWGDRYGYRYGYGGGYGGYGYGGGYGGYGGYGRRVYRDTFYGDGGYNGYGGGYNGYRYNGYGYGRRYCPPRYRY